MLGHIMEWFYSDLAGIQPDPAAAGFKKIMIKPTPVGDVTWAKASYDSVRGRIETAWAVHGSTFTLDVVIPPNCTATVRLPKRFTKTITEGGKPIAEVRDIAVTTGATGSPVIAIPSGNYHFVSHAE
jgi:hypothetical protein